MEQVATLAGLDNTDSNDGDVFFRTAKRFESMRLQWEAKLRPEELLVSTTSNPPSVNEMSLSEALALNLYDNDWIMNYLLDPNH